MTRLCALLALLIANSVIANFVITIISIYDLTIYSYSFNFISLNIIFSYLWFVICIHIMPLILVTKSYWSLVSVLWLHYATIHILTQ